MQTPASKHMKAAPAGEPFVPPDCFDACNKPVLTISLSGRKLPASSHEISQMPVDDFVALWAVSTLLWKPSSRNRSANGFQHVPSAL